jgi:ribonuclease P protein component
VKRLLRLKDASDFQRVWASDRKWSHPLLALRARPNNLTHSRCGFVAGRKIGKATARNRAKRLMREAARLYVPDLAEPTDLVLIAGRGMPAATLAETRAALDELLRRARLVSSE